MFRVISTLTGDFIFFLYLDEVGVYTVVAEFFFVVNGVKVTQSDGREWNLSLRFYLQCNKQSMFNWISSDTESFKTSSLKNLKLRCYVLRSHYIQWHTEHTYVSIEYITISPITSIGVHIFIWYFASIIVLSFFIDRWKNELNKEVLILLCWTITKMTQCKNIGYTNLIFCSISCVLFYCFQSLAQYLHTSLWRRSPGIIYIFGSFPCTAVLITWYCVDSVYGL